MFDIVATQDQGNTQARAEVAVDGTVILDALPVPTLLFLEKQLQDVHTFVAALPVLEQGEDWTLDVGTGLHKTDPVESIRTKKTQKPIVKYDATKEHPAQTELITEDVTVGHWLTTKFSSALPRPEIVAMLRRVEALQDAVKRAREAANIIEVEPVNIGDSLFTYIFNGE